MTLNKVEVLEWMKVRGESAKMLKQSIVFGKQTADVSSHARSASFRVLQCTYNRGWFIRRKLSLSDSSC